MNCHCCKNKNAEMREIGKEAEILLCDECYNLYQEMEGKYFGKINKTA